MSWATLKEQFEPMSPSEAQWEHIAAAHDAYLSGWETLRDEKIEPFIEDSKGDMGLGIGDPENTRRRLSQGQAIRRQIAGVDDAMFAAIATTIGDSQKYELDRLQQRRQRDRARATSGVLFGLGAPDIEPRDGIRWSTLNDAQRSSVEATLDPWEDRYTTLLEQWSDANVRAMKIFSESVSELSEAQSKFDLENPPSPEEMNRFIEIFQGAKQNGQRITSGPMEHIQTHILKGLNDLSGEIPVDQRLEMLKEVANLYSVRDRVPRAAKAARTYELSDSQAVELNEIVLQWQEDATPLALSLLEARWKDRDLQRQQMMTAVDGSMEIKVGQPEFGAKARGDWDNRQNKSIDAIMGMIPEEHRKTINGNLAHSMVDPDPPPLTESSTSVVVMGSTADIGDDGGGSVTISASVSSTDDPFSGIGGDLKTIPGIPTTTMKGLARDLQLDDSQTVSLNAIYQTHEDARLGIQQERVAERDKIKEELAKDMQAGKTPDQAAMMRLGMMMMQPISDEGLSELDATFFEDVQSLTDDRKTVSMWRMARERQLSQRGGGMLSMSLDMIGIPDDRWRVDLLEVIESADLSEPDRLASRAAIENWHAPATKSLLELQDLQQKVEEGMQAMLGDPVDGGALQVDMVAAMEVEKTTQLVTAKREKLTDLTQATIDSVLEQVNDRYALQQAWTKDAFPALAGEDQFEQLYENAMSTTDLSDDQRATIAEMRLSHREAWWNDTETIIAVITAAPPADGTSEEAFVEGQRVRQTVDTKSFARREAALKRAEKLRKVLTDTQLSNAGGLPDPPKGRQMSLPF